VPSCTNAFISGRREKGMSECSRVVIGMDPHKRSATIEVMGEDETVLGKGRYSTDQAGFAAMLADATRWPQRVWAVEGCEGIGKHLVLRLLDAGETVVDVPAKLSARMRVYATGQGRKTDDTDAHSIALVGVRMAGLRQVVNDETLEVLRLLVDRRRRIGEDHTRMVCQLHVLLLELIPGGAKKDLSAAQARQLLATVRPKDAAAKTRKRVALELVRDLERLYARKKAANNSSNSSRSPEPGCSTCTASTRPGRRGCWSRSVTSPGSRPRATSRPGSGPPPSTHPPATTCVIGFPAAATARSTGRCT
jgi:hypothetical protein